MTRLLLLLFLMTFSAYAKEKSCYSVQIKSAIATDKNVKMLRKGNYPQACQVMTIGHNVTVRCGCYETYKEVKAYFPMIKKRYKQAYINQTYKYRFKKYKKQVKISQQQEKKIVPQKSIKVVQKGVSPKRVHKKEKISEEEEELRLMLQTFIYSGKTKDAFSVAKIGYKRYPNSTFWNKQMSTFSKWSMQPQDALKYDLYMYRRTHDKKLRDDIINYGLSAYQYKIIEQLVIEKAVENPNKTNIDLMIFIEDKLGTTEIAAKILQKEYLKHQNNPMYLNKALQVYIDLGEMDAAKNIVNTLEKKKFYSTKSVSLISYYYYIKNQLSKAYSILLLANDITQNSDVKYYQLVSDLGWFMQDYKRAAEASQKLMTLKNARLVDYKRVMQVYKKSNTELSLNVAKESYFKYKKSYVFYDYANSAMALKKYNDLKESIQKIEKSDDAIKNDPKYLLIKAQVYNHFNDKKRAFASLHRAQKLSPKDYNIRLDILWFYLQNSMNSELKKAILEIEELPTVYTTFYIPLASAYYQLGNIDKADFYLQKAIDAKLPNAKSIDMKFLQAYIYQAKNNQNGYKQKLQEILDDLEFRSIEIYGFKESQTYWTSYLSAAMYILDAQNFERKLETAKKYITQQQYDELLYSWSIKIGAIEQSHEIYNYIKNKPLWMKFSDDILFQNYTSIQNLLDTQREKLSQGDAAKSAYDDGQISLAQSINYDILDKNYNNQSAYMQHINLAKERSDKFDMRVGYYDTKPLTQKSVKIKNRTYAANGISVDVKLTSYHNHSSNKNSLNILQKSRTESDLAVKKRFKNGSIGLHVGLVSDYNNYRMYGLELKRELNKEFEAEVAVEKNMNTLDTTQMLISAKKDMLKTAFNWQFLESTSLEFLLEGNYFSSQDNIYIGSGKYARIAINQQYRNGYPDIGASLYVDGGTYREVSQIHGIIDTTQGGVFRVLPADFFNIGGELRLGMVNSNLYTRVWRPYLSVAPYYNTNSGTFNIGVNGGYGGSMLGQDHLVLGASYSQPATGVANNIYELFLKYQFLYTH